MKTSKLLRKLRKNANLSQAKLADIVGFPGNGGKQLISNIERGVCLIPFDRVPMFAIALRASDVDIYRAMMSDEIAKIEHKYDGLT